MILNTCTKVNVGLNVLRRRSDGYHDIETLFVPYYGYSDTITVEPSKYLTISIDHPDYTLWDPFEDLTVKAWRLLKADFPDLPAVSIHLQKQAPVGAGLGGGSADAAFMLRGLNELFSLGLDTAALVSYASRLGSDCAFFIHCRPMFATGRGEVLEPFDIDLPAFELRVEVPLDSDGNPVAVSTKEAYAGIVPRNLWTPSAGTEAPLREALRLPVEQWRGLVVNDFEPTVCPLHPEIPALIEDFYRRGAIYAAMSGSGSSVFGFFRK